ncbi:complex I subunit 5 family protein [Nitrospina watsonii]|uniref:Monovalent cation/H+ antiporter, subunit D n=1 Tax=Nitrospina watsonii TaxID=1323948 RepID=A0ABN8W010_9BACT|nr:proton-conducting transporter membrane subunit [Nitrospina watsonii]CAI2717551.1 Putative Monovalent cation/H+ antiporter, subunit D [Nitrospina watsonii]
MNHQLPAILFLLPLFAAVSMPVVCLKHRHWSHPISVAILAAMVPVSILNLYNVIQHGEVRYMFSGWTAPFGIEWVADGLASVVLVLLSILGLLGVVFTGPTSPKALGGRIVHYYTMILLLVSALTGIVFSRDLFNLFVFLEVASISSYALIGVAGGRALFAAFRYLILGTLGGSLFLLGVGYLYALTGTLNMTDMAARLPLLLSSKALVGGLLFMFIGLGIKMALVPFHSWMPEAYTYAPESVSPILASLVTKVALLAWIRIIYWVLNSSIVIFHIPILLLVAVIGSLAAVIGASLALAQRDIKMMFAYGGISHIGIILIGIGQGNQTGFVGGIFYLLNDAVMQAALFFLAGVAFCLHGIKTIDDLGRVGRQTPWLTGSLVVVAMGMIGLPPTGGFFGKWYIILGALEAGDYVSVAAVVLSTLLTLAYFVKLFESIFRQASTRSDVQPGEIPFTFKLSLGVTSAAVMILGLFSGPIVQLLLNRALPPHL